MDRTQDDSVLILMVNGASALQLERVCREKFGFDKKQAARAISAAKKRLTLAAEYNRDEQLGTAITRMNSLYSRAVVEGDIKIALTAQREINKLLDLYRESEAQQQRAGAGNADAEIELDAIGSQLLPLGLAGKDYPLREHARIAADIIQELKAREQGDDSGSN